MAQTRCATDALERARTRQVRQRSSRPSVLTEGPWPMRLGAVALGVAGCHNPGAARAQWRATRCNLYLAVAQRAGLF